MITKRRNNFSFFIADDYLVAHSVPAQSPEPIGSLRESFALHFQQQMSETP
jgi:hypothetical protein